MISANLLYRNLSSNLKKRKVQMCVERPKSRKVEKFWGWQGQKRRERKSWNANDLDALGGPTTSTTAGPLFSNKLRPFARSSTPSLHEQGCEAFFLPSLALISTIEGQKLTWTKSRTVWSCNRWVAPSFQTTLQPSASKLSSSFFSQVTQSPIPAVKMDCLDTHNFKYVP